MKFTLEIDSDNAAMRSREDVVDTLRNVIDRLERGGVGNHIYDVNGNKVGTWEFDDSEDSRKELCEKVRGLSRARKVELLRDVQVTFEYGAMDSELSGLIFAAIDDGTIREEDIKE